MNQKAEKFFDAITLLREDLVEEAQNYVFRKKRSGWKTLGSLAACMALVASLGLLAAMPRGCGAANNSIHIRVDVRLHDADPDLVLQKLHRARQSGGLA